MIKSQITARIAALEWTVMPMINIIGAFVTLMGAFAFGWIGNLPMTIAMLAGVIYFKEWCYGINRNINKVYYGAIFACGSRKATPSIDNSYVGNPALYERR